MFLDILTLRLIYEYLEYAGLGTSRAMVVTPHSWFAPFSQAPGLAAIILYDYILTLDAEISSIWTIPLPKASLWFLMNRYPPIIAHTVFRFLGLANSIGADQVRR